MAWCAGEPRVRVWLAQQLQQVLRAWQSQVLGRAPLQARAPWRALAWQRAQPQREPAQPPQEQRRVRLPQPW